MIDINYIELDTKLAQLILPPGTWVQSSARSDFVVLWHGQPWTPTSKIEHAFDIIMYFQGKGWGFGLVGYPTCKAAEPGHPYKAGFFNEKNTYEGFGPAPLAICLAALKALEAK